MFSSVLVLLLAQDLLERSEKKGTYSYQAYSGRDRFDLSAGARIPTSGKAGSGRLGIDASIESDFACGKFDLKANLRSLVSKEAADDFANALVGAVEGELAYNALMLLAEASPTAFQLLQHFRVNANALLGINYDRCQAIEQAVSDGLKGIRARAIKDCVAEKQRAGTPMDQALAECEKSDEIRSITGEKVKELDLLDEVRKAFDIPEVDFQNLEKLLSRIRIKPGGVTSGEVRSDAVLDEYESLERGYHEAWFAVTDRIAKDPKWVPDDEAAKKLIPGAPAAAGPLLTELRELARIPANRRKILLERIARQAALLELTKRVQDLERMLAALAQHPQADEAYVRRREQEAREIRRQLAHVIELARRQDEYNAALLALSHAGRAYQTKEVEENLYRELSVESSESYFSKTPEWGAIPKGTKAPTKPEAKRYEGRGCTNCGFGDVAKEKK